MHNILMYVKKSPISHLLMIVVFFVSGIIINSVQCVLYYGLHPISKFWYRKINYYLAYSLYSQLVFMAEWWSGTTVHIYIDKDDFHKYYGKEHAYLVMNHRYDVDWLVGWIFCERIGVLGNCKAYAKKSIKYVPTMGWAWKFAESVFLERNWDKDREAIRVQVRELADYPDPIMLLLFAEGTRFTSEKHEASLTFAREKGLPQLKQHLTPRTKGFTCSVPHLRGKVDAIYDVQLAFKQNAKVQPTVTNMLLGKSVEGHLYLGRIPLSEVPEDEEEAAQWLRDLYCRKDKMMESFLHTGDFFSESGLPKIEAFQLPRRYYSLINMAVWAIVVLVPVFYYLTRLITSGSSLYISIGIAIILFFFFLLYKLIELTKISKGSSYGKTTPTTPVKDDVQCTDLVTDECIAANSLVFLTGGAEAVANSISFTLYELAYNPKVQKRLQEEVDSVLKKYGGQLTYEGLKEMTYLDLVIQEKNRKYSEGGFLMRVCDIPYTIPGSDVVVQKGTRIVIPLFAIHNDPANYPDPDEFIPERFEGNNHRITGTYLPFGDGPRVCIAMRFVILELKACIAKVMSRYTVTLDSKTHTPLQYDPKAFNLAPKGGIWIRCHKRI